jgi:glutathione S-transferase
MRIYIDHFSTVSLPVLMFLAEHDLQAEVITVSLLKGEQLTPEYAAINPSKAVPTMQHGEFILTESSAILKYVAEAVSSATYPSDMKARARVNELMDWFNTGLFREFGYGVVYP